MKSLQHINDVYTQRFNRKHGVVTDHYFIDSKISFVTILIIYYSEK